LICCLQLFVGHVFRGETSVYTACWCPFVYIGGTTIQTTRSLKDVCLRYGIYVVCGEEQLIKSHQDAFTYSRTSQECIPCTSLYKSWLVTLLQCVRFFFFTYMGQCYFHLKSSYDKSYMWEQIYNKTFTFLSAQHNSAQDFPQELLVDSRVIITLIFLLVLFTLIDSLGQILDIKIIVDFVSFVIFYSFSVSTSITWT
jgi:hypothetical protein